MTKFAKNQHGMLPALRETPPIPFVSRTKKVETECAEVDKTEYIKFDFFVDPENPASRYSKEFLVFKDGCPEEWIKWLMAYRDLEVMMPLKEVSERTKMLWTLLKGRALAQFDYHLSKQIRAEDIELPDHELLELVIKDLGLDYISRHAIRVQKYYMRRCLFMGPNTTVQQFVERLNDLNRYLLYFPEEYPSQLKQDEIVEILDQAKAPEWHEAMVSANIDIFEMNYEEAVAYFIRLENLEKIRRTNGPAVAVDNKKLITSSVGVGKNKSSNMWCHYCDKTNHNTADCKAIMRAKQHKKAKSEAKAVPGKKALAFLFEEINALKKQLKPPAKGTNPKKRKAESLLSTEINLTNSSEEDEEYFAFPSPISNASNKLAKTSHPTSELVVSLIVNHEEHVLRALADTGASSSIILDTYAPKNLIIYDDDKKPPGVQWVVSLPLIKLD